MRENGLKTFIILLMQVIKEAVCVFPVKFSDVIKMFVANLWVQQHFPLVSYSQCYRRTLSDRNNPIRMFVNYFLRDECLQLLAIELVAIIHLAERRALHLNEDFIHHEIVLFIKSRILD